MLPRVTALSFTAIFDSGCLIWWGLEGWGWVGWKRTKSRLRRKKTSPDANNGASPKAHLKLVQFSTSQSAALRSTSASVLLPTSSIRNSSVCCARLAFTSVSTRHSTSPRPYQRLRWRSPMANNTLASCSWQRSSVNFSPYSPSNFWFGWPIVKVRTNNNSWKFVLICGVVLKPQIPRVTRIYFCGDFYATNHHKFPQIIFSLNLAESVWTLMICDDSCLPQ